ncbi:MAG: PAS domain S-box protein [Acidobacteriota bacterium]|nr:PAS domain S-box protein [Acidobacteriota bacterium]
MSLILIVSIVIRISALVLSVRAYLRIKDSRMILLILLFFLMVIRQVFTLWSSPWQDGLSWSVHWDEIPGLLVSILSMMLIIVLQRLLWELKYSRDRLEDDNRLLTQTLEEEHQLLAESRNRSQILFDHAGVTLIQYDYSQAMAYLKTQGIEDHSDPETFLMEHPEIIREVVSLVRVAEGNREVARFFGTRVPAGLDIYDFLTPVSIKTLCWELVALLHGRQRLEYDTQLKNGSGQIVHLHVKWVRLPEPPYNVLVSALDISDRMITRRALQENEARLRDLFENATDLIQNVSPDGRLVYVNRAWKNTLGYTDAEVRDLTMQDFIHPESMEHCMAIFGKLMAGESVGVIEARFVAKDGRSVDVEGNLSMRFSEGKAASTRGIFRDVTGQKNMLRNLEAAQQVANTAIHNIGNLLNSVKTSTHKMLEVLEGSRLPAVIRGFDLLSEQGDEAGHFISDDERGKKLPYFFQKGGRALMREHEQLIKENNALLGKVDLMAEITRGQQSSVKDRGESLDLIHMMDAALAIQADGLTIDGVIVHKTYKVAGKPTFPKTEVMNVFLNLLKNAREALQANENEPRNLAVSIRESENGQVVTIKDNGQGVAPDDLTKLFRYGFTTKSDGHGFGLNYCAGVMNDLGGKIEAESGGPGMGTTFHLTFPLPEMERDSVRAAP